MESIRSVGGRAGQGKGRDLGSMAEQSQCRAYGGAVDEEVEGVAGDTFKGVWVWGMGRGEGAL